jgi:mycothiol synthase
MFKEQTRTILIEERFIVRAPTLDDVQDVLEMLEICDVVMVGEIEVSADMLQKDWTNPAVDINRNFRVITTQDGRVAGYGELWDDQEPLVRTWSWNRVHPEFEGQGLGTYLMNWGEKLARQSMVKAPPEARLIMYTEVPGTYQPAVELMRGQGMELTRHFFIMKVDMIEQPPAPKLSERITIRPMRNLDELPAVVEAVQDSFRDHWGFVEQTPENLLANWKHRIETTPSFDSNLWFLAMDGDNVAGMCLCWSKHGADEQLGWVSTLGVLRPWRRRGLGQALLQHSFAEFYRRGKSKVGLGVDAESLTGAVRLYEKVGMRVTRRLDKYVKEIRPGIDWTTRTI